jgi:hypothetical protein
MGGALVVFWGIVLFDLKEGAFVRGKLMVRIAMDWERCCFLESKWLQKSPTIIAK